MGKVIMSGIVPQLVAPKPPGIQASELAVGSIVQIKVSGTAKDFIVVHKGRPSSEYDASCDGVWLLMKDIYTNAVFNSSSWPYASSTAHSTANTTFYNALDSETKAAIKQVKIPYVSSFSDDGCTATIASGSSGLSTKVFLLSIAELGYPISSTGMYLPKEGAKLSYFPSTTSYSDIRKAYRGSSISDWWTRSNRTTSQTWFIDTDGTFSYKQRNQSIGIRPCFILPNNALFDENTLILKGVA